MEQPARPSPQDLEQYAQATVNRINWDLGPMLPTWAYFRGKAFREKFPVLLRSTVWGIERELSQPEVDAFLECSAKGVQTQALLDVPVTAGITYVLFSRGRATYRFPFYQPTTLDPDRFRIPPLAAATGARARALWHACRFLSYYIVTKFMVTTPIASLGAYVSMEEFRRDARLDQFRKEERLERERAASQRRTDPRQPPLPGSFAQRRPGQPYPGGGEQTQQQQQQQTLFDDRDPFDDASPVAPSHRGAGGPGSASSGAGGSAWDRLRQQSAQQQQQQQQQQQSAWDSRRSRAAPGAQDSQQDWTFSNPEDSKAESDRAKAQKEFDEMLERERRSEAGNSRGRWN